MARKNKDRNKDLTHNIDGEYWVEITYPALRHNLIFAEKQLIKHDARYRWVKENHKRYRNRYSLAIPKEEYLSIFSEFAHAQQFKNVHNGRLKVR